MPPQPGASDLPPAIPAPVLYSQPPVAGVEVASQAVSAILVFEIAAR
jgi:hypothetical protein